MTPQEFTKLTDPEKAKAVADSLGIAPEHLTLDWLFELCRENQIEGNLFFSRDSTTANLFQVHTALISDESCQKPIDAIAFAIIGFKTKPKCIGGFGPTNPLSTSEP